MRLGRFASLGAFLAAALLAGCASFTLDEEPLPYVPRNFAGEPRLPDTIRRVVLLPVAGAATGARPEELDAALLAALQQAQRFEVVPLARDACRRRYGAEAFNSTAALPPDFLATLGREHAADAVLFVDVTTRRFYPPLTLGLRARLATVADVRLVWTYDEVIAADDPAVVVAVRRRHYQPGNPVDLGPATLQSPARFGAFAAEMMFSTLPSR